MKATILSAPRTICQNPKSIHNYFGWPSVAKLQDGSLAMTASGFRLGHVCPFGKAVLCRSFDEGKSWTAPEVIIDTPLDDRDSGVATFGDKGVIVTSFNNTPAFQRSSHPDDPYIAAYLDRIEKDPAHLEKLGSTFVLSEDGGTSFGEVMLSPVTSPHGPIELNDGTLLYIGSFFEGIYDSQYPTQLGSVKIYPDGRTEVIGTIEDINGVLLSCEPYAIQLPDGRIIVHIRVEREGYFSTWQSESFDGGHTFTKPHALLEKHGGAPAHLIYHSSGTLISVYGYRDQPFGIRFMVSRDLGESWETGLVLTDGYPSGDLGYPCSVELSDGSILTVYYAHENDAAPATIMQVIWRIED